MAPTDFTYTGTYDTYTVPTGITRLDIELIGAAGGDQGIAPVQPQRALGGLGARIKIRAAVTSGEVLRVYVGGQGGVGTTGPSPTYVGAAGAGGYNGGANGGYVDQGIAQQIPGGGGGGATEIRRSPYGTGDAIAVAGGGGGAGSNGTDPFDPTPSSGGNGGYPDGADGADGEFNGTSGGGGATASAGGAGGAYSGTGVNGTAGAANTGGAGAVLYRGGGGGGGGVYGGGGGGGSNTAGTSGGGGGGGSSMTTGLLLESGVASTRDHGSVTITPRGSGFYRGKHRIGPAGGLG